MTITSLPFPMRADLFEAQAALNKRKKHLTVRADQTAAQWSELARAYELIDSRANAAYCKTQAQHQAQTENKNPLSASESGSGPSQMSYDAAGS
jgi:hypothetical protein